MSRLVDLAREFFTGVKIEREVIDNPFIEGGPLVLVEKYFSPNGEQFGSGYGIATKKQIRRLYAQ